MIREEEDLKKKYYKAKRSTIKPVSKKLTGIVGENMRTDIILGNKDIYTFLFSEDFEEKWKVEG